MNGVGDFFPLRDLGGGVDTGSEGVTAGSDGEETRFQMGYDGEWVGRVGWSILYLEIGKSAELKEEDVCSLLRDECSFSNQ